MPPQDPIKQLRILFAAHFYVHTGSRKVQSIATASGLTTAEVFDLCEMPVWSKALAFFGHTESFAVDNAGRNRKRKRANTGDLKTAENLWSVLIREGADINPPADFSVIYNEVFGDTNSTEKPADDEVNHD